MPCCCDGYEVSASDVREEMGAQLEHMRGQLCNAQSLIHKLLKHIDAAPQAPVTPKPLPADLRKRAEEHIKILLTHKRKEHQDDVVEAQRERDELNRQLSALEVELQDLQRKHMQVEQNLDLRKRQIREAYDKARRAAQPNPTDDELLG